MVLCFKFCVSIAPQEFGTILNRVQRAEKLNKTNCTGCPAAEKSSFRYSSFAKLRTEKNLFFLSVFAVRYWHSN